MKDYETLMVQKWTAECFESHSHCREDEEVGFVPTRLIEIGESNHEIKLILTNDEVPKDRRYLALSHCWGSAMPESAKTNESTLPQHIEAINRDDLPQTFKDVIDISRRLGIQHVWIDSLCIIQDSTPDWEFQAGRMASVYSNAYLTISASGSRDGTGGCGMVNEEMSYGPVDIQRDDTELKDDSASPPKRKFRVWSRSPFFVGQVIRDDPLSQRGWTMQERELSPRFVHYSRDTVRAGNAASSRPRWNFPGATPSPSTGRCGSSTTASSTARR